MRFHLLQGTRPESEMHARDHLYRYWAHLSYCLASLNEVSMMIVYERLPLSIEFAYFCGQDEMLSFG